jgi:hypothetical protein
MQRKVDDSATDERSSRSPILVMEMKQSPVDAAGLL